ncbi:MAG TPA: CopG family transcriptional regulator [Gemmatimonadaceae bacterium]|nr:CopG family transcriptional regulator [Gemmatimonadaceae bacterium]
MSPKKRVREPVQVYLDQHDRSLLDRMATESSLSRAEILRLGLRRLSVEMLAEARPGSSLSALVGALDDAADVPPDLGARHDDYLYGKPEGE